MPTVKLAHVALWTADMERMTAFWAELFNATVGERYESARRPGFSSRFLRLSEGAALEIMQAPWIAARPDGEHWGYAHVAVSVGTRAAVDAVAARARALHILESGPRMTGDGYYEAVLFDPDGNRVEVTE